MFIGVAVERVHAVGKINYKLNNMSLEMPLAWQDMSETTTPKVINSLSNKRVRCIIACVVAHCRCRCQYTVEGFLGKFERKFVTSRGRLKNLRVLVRMLHRLMISGCMGVSISVAVFRSHATAKKEMPLKDVIQYFSRPRPEDHQ